VTDGVAPERRRAAAQVLVDDVAAPSLNDATAHHVLRVLRLRDGEAVSVTDGAGRWRICRISGEAVVPDGEIAIQRRCSDPITIALAIPKSDRPDWVVQKLTELGVGRIVLLHTARSVVHWEGDRGERQVAKLRKVAVEALQQSRGVWLPEVTGPLPALDVLPRAVAAEPCGRPLDRDDRVIAIGPEGGWTKQELDAAAGTVQLVGNVLRVDTAAVVAGALALQLGR
jgi:16S rRNA (uracil1498-N3)-methyltransferase